MDKRFLIYMRQIFVSQFNNPPLSRSLRCGRVFWAILGLGMLLGGCTAKNVEQYELINMGKKVDPDFHLVLPGINDVPVSCVPYGTGCQLGIRVQHKFLSFLMINYAEPEQAQRAAAHLGQYYYKNWLFDQVAGEKILEEFVQAAYQAQKGWGEI